MLPFDLHVLGLPPAFTLSQDQTLHLSIALHPEGFGHFFECRIRPKPHYYSNTCICMLSMNRLGNFVTNICKMDNHPLARRPHKSPAHTVKDPGVGLSA